MAKGDGNQLMEPTRYRIETKTRASAILALAGIALVLIFAALPAFAGRGLIQDLIFVFYMLALAQCWNLLAGYAGLVSVGQQAFVGLGGYLLFALTIGAGIDPIAAVVLSGLIAAIFAVPTAFVVFRLRGPYFAIGSWVVAEVYRLVFAQFKQLGGGTGTSLPPSATNEIFGIEWVKAMFEVRSPAARDIITYWIALALAAGAPLLVYLVLRSRYGLALFAIRDSEATAESAGVDSFRTKLGVYVLVAAATGMIGALIYLAEGAYLAGCCVFGAGLERLRDFYRRHRRRRHDRRSNYRRDRVLHDAALPCGLRHLVSDFARRTCDCHHVVRPEGHLGVCRAALPRRAISRAKNFGAAARLK